MFPETSGLSTYRYIVQCIWWAVTLWACSNVNLLCPGKLRRSCYKHRGRKTWTKSFSKKTAVRGVYEDSPVLRSVVRAVAGELAAPHCVIHGSEGQKPAGCLGSHLLSHQYFTPDTFTSCPALFFTRAQSWECHFHVSLPGQSQMFPGKHMEEIYFLGPELQEIQTTCRCAALIL